MYSLTRAEVEIIEKGLVDKNSLPVFTDYWFGKGDGTGFTYDYKFEEAYRWQYKLVYARQPLIVVIAGIGTGKTLGVGMAGVTWAISTEGFKFMNGANWAYQAKLMYDLIIGQITDTPAEKLVDRAVESPYPKIIFKYKIGKSTYTSSLEFMSMDKNAAKIFSWRGDWINLDEAALITELDIAMMNLSTRLTGNTPRGREYLGRMSLMSNAWDNESSSQLYYFYDMAIDEPNECLSITLPTQANKNVSDRQVTNALRFIPKDEQGRLLAGERPEGKGLYFSKPTVNACTDHYMSEFIEMKFTQNTPGYNMVRVPTIGVVQYEQPTQSSHLILLGDPGTEVFPARNAPVLGLFDTSGVPSAPAKLVSFWWGNGGGRIQPFVEKLLEWKQKYNPFFTGVDSTGPQAGLTEMINITSFYDTDLKSFGGSVAGMDFSGGRKPQYLVALRILLEAQLITWPDFAKGIRSQLTNYDPAKDRAGVPKIAQDIVSMFSMAALVIRAYYHIEAPPPPNFGGIRIPNKQEVEHFRRTPDLARFQRRT